MNYNKKKFMGGVLKELPNCFIFLQKDFRIAAVLERIEETDFYCSRRSTLYFEWGQDDRVIKILKILEHFFKNVLVLHLLLPTLKVLEDIKTKLG